jgi:hypothetical protein
MSKNKKAFKKEQVVEVLTLKPGSSFKLKPEFKMLLANIHDKHERGAWKRMYIQAQLAEQHAGLKSQKGYLEMFKGGV